MKDVAEQMARKNTVKTIIKSWPVHSYFGSCRSMRWYSVPRNLERKNSNTVVLKYRAEGLGVLFVKSSSTLLTTEGRDDGAHKTH